MKLFLELWISNYDLSIDDDYLKTFTLVVLGTDMAEIQRKTESFLEVFSGGVLLKPRWQAWHIKTEWRSDRICEAYLCKIEKEKRHLVERSHAFPLMYVQLKSSLDEISTPEDVIENLKNLKPSQSV